MTDIHEHQRSNSELPPTPGVPPAAADREDDSGHPVRLGILGALVALLGLMGGWPTLVVVLGVVVMIFLHELGHYLAAKASGMKVTEFFIGFGPKIWSFRKGETEYGLKAIPAGAYVKIIGMNNLDEVADGDEDLTYRSKSYPKRMLVAVAGSGMHFAQAIVLLFVLFAFVGIPGGSITELEAWDVGEIQRGSAADEYDLELGDRILAVDGETFGDYDDFRDLIGGLPNEDVVMEILRDGEVVQLPITIGVRETDATKGLLGIRPDARVETVGPVRAVGTAFSEFGNQTTATLGFLGKFFTPSGISDFAGDVADGQDDSTITVPEGSSSGEAVEAYDEGRIMSIVGAVRLGSNLTEDGILGFLVFFIGINITIGIFNLLPVLPLDGGHVVVATYERIREIGRPKGFRHHVDFARLIPVVYAVFILLVMLGVSTIFLDIVDPV